MNILVYKQDEEGFKCPKCGEVINLDFLDNIMKNNNQNDVLKELKSQLENIINLNDINKIKNQVKMIKITLDNIISENEININNIKNSINKYNQNSNEINILRNESNIIIVNHEIISPEINTLFFRRDYFLKKN